MTVVGRHEVHGGPGRRDRTRPGAPCGGAGSRMTGWVESYGRRAADMARNRPGCARRPEASLQLFLPYIFYPPGQCFCLRPLSSACGRMPTPPSGKAKPRKPCDKRQPVGAAGRGGACRTGRRSPGGARPGGKFSSSSSGLFALDGCWRADGIARGVAASPPTCDFKTPGLAPPVKSELPGRA